jgi:hypothetical protein
MESVVHREKQMQLYLAPGIDAFFSISRLCFVHISPYPFVSSILLDLLFALHEQSFWDLQGLSKIELVIYLPELQTFVRS